MIARENAVPNKTRLIAYVGSYGTTGPTTGGGIDVFDVSSDGRELTHLSRVDNPKLTGHLVYAARFEALYAVDEQATEGRGLTDTPASVHAFAVDQHDGSLRWLNSQSTPGPRPTFVSVCESNGMLYTANRGDFQHTEHVFKTPDGNCITMYSYDDSTVVQLQVATNGSLGAIQDVHVFSGNGREPNFTSEVGGHPRSTPQACCAVIDPSGKFLVVCDKATDRMYVFRTGSSLALAATFQFPEETGPRHAAFDPLTQRAYISCEFSSELASFDFDDATGEPNLIDRVSTVQNAFAGYNQPAEVRTHPKGEFVYVNNRGEDSIAWFRADEIGLLQRLGHISITKSAHSGIAARSFAFAPSGDFVLVADRPGNMIRSYAVSDTDGSLHPLAEISLAGPAYITFVELSSAARNESETA